MIDELEVGKKGVLMQNRERRLYIIWSLHSSPKNVMFRTRRA